MPSSNNDTNNQTAFDEIMALAVGTMTSSFISVVIGMTVCIAMYRSKYKLKVRSRSCCGLHGSEVVILDWFSFCISLDWTKETDSYIKQTIEKF